MKSSRRLSIAAPPAANLLVSLHSIKWRKLDTHPVWPRTSSLPLIMERRLRRRLRVSALLTRGHQVGAPTRPSSTAVWTPSTTRPISEERPWIESDPSAVGDCGRCGMSTSARMASSANMCVGTGGDVPWAGSCGDVSRIDESLMPCLRIGVCPNSKSSCGSSKSACGSSESEIVEHESS